MLKTQQTRYQAAHRGTRFRGFVSPMAAILLGFGLALAQEAPPPAPPAPQTPAPSGDIRVNGTPDTRPRGLETRITLNADDAFLPAVLAVLAERSGFNIVTGPEVNRQQRVSIHLRDTPVEEAINLVVRAAGLSYEIVGNSFLVTEAENLKTEVGLSSHMIDLQYASATEVRGLLKDLTENVQVDTARNALLISTSPKIISEVRRIVTMVDVPSRQIMLRARVLEVSLKRTRQLGVDWEKLSRLTVILAENPATANGGFRVPTKTDLGTTPLGQLPSEHIYQPVDGLSNVGHFSRQLQAFNVTLDYLIRNNAAELLSDTKLTTMNNRTAAILIGEIIPFLVQSEQTAQVEREEIGVKLEITPQINNDGFITAHIKPEVSSIVELISGTIPRKKIRTAETTVLVRDRQKIFIAGLLKTEEKTEVHKIPFLGDLLFVGRFFQHEYKEIDQTDLVIEITPYILNNAEEVDALMADTLFQRRLLDEAKPDRPDAPPSREPTHLAMTPTAKVLPPFHYTIGAQEVALGQFGNFQLAWHPWLTVGRLQWGFKWSPTPGLALAAGYHRGMFVNEGKYNLGTRLGVYLVKDFVSSRWFDWYGGLDAQLGEWHSFGASTGFGFHPVPGFSLIGEVMNNYTPETPTPDVEYWDPWATAAVRFQWPWQEGLSLSAGASARTRFWLDEPYSRIREDYTLMPYLNIAYTGQF